MINESKLVEWVEDETGSLNPMFIEDNIVKGVYSKLLDKINSGEFDCEEVKTTNPDKLKSKWKPKLLEAFYAPIYRFGKWSCEHVQYRSHYKRTANKGEAFKTEAACKRYVNAKGWFNDEEWEV